jgi:hypothetical protein
MWCSIICLLIWHNTSKFHQYMIMIKIYLVICVHMYPKKILFWILDTFLGFHPNISIFNNSNFILELLLIFGFGYYFGLDIGWRIMRYSVTIYFWWLWLLLWWFSTTYRLIEDSPTIFPSLKFKRSLVSRIFYFSNLTQASREYLYCFQLNGDFTYLYTLLFI